MTVGLGVDIVEIDRMRGVLERSPAFARRVFTPAEQAYCASKPNAAARFAARFAAKEAVCKALGTGILVDGMRMTDVEVVRDHRGKPAVALHGRAAEIARELGVLEIPLSLTYTHSVAVANAVAITESSRVEQEKRRDPKAEVMQRFREVRGMLDELGDETADQAERAIAKASAAADSNADF